MDFPKAPEQVGMVLATMLECGALPPSDLVDGFLQIPDVFARRTLAAGVFQAAQKAMGAGLSKMFREAGISAAAFLTHDPEMDGDLPEVDDFLSEIGVAL